MAAAGRSKDEEVSVVDLASSCTLCTLVKVDSEQRDTVQRDGVSKTLPYHWIDLRGKPQELRHSHSLQLQIRRHPKSQPRYSVRTVFCTQPLMRTPPS